MTFLSCLALGLALAIALALLTLAGVMIGWWIPRLLTRRAARRSAPPRAGGDPLA